MLATLMVASYLSYLLFESRTYAIRRALKDRMLRRRLPRAGSSPLSTKP